MRLKRQNKITVEIRLVQRQNERAEDILSRLEQMKKEHPDFAIRAEIRDIGLN